MKKLVSQVEALSNRACYAFLAVAYVLLHGALYLRGVRFETYPIEAYLHMLDLDLLRTRLLESCYYLHIQPPAFNFFVGVVLKLFGDAHPAAFHLLYLAMGFGILAALFYLLSALGLGRTLSLALTLLFMCSPPFILFEHWLFYTVPCTFLLVLSAALFWRIVSAPAAWNIGGFFASIFLLCMLRSMFHLVFFVFLYAVLLAIVKTERRRVAVLGAVPLLLIAGLYAKNAYHFGQFTASTLMGKNLWVLTVGNLNYETREQWVKEGKLSELSLIARFNTTTYYPDEYVNVKGFETIPALRQAQKSNGPHNFNHIAHVGISKQYMDDALYGLRHSPKTFVLSTAISWFAYLRPQYKASPDNAELLRPLMAFYDWFVYWKSPVDFRNFFSAAKTTNNPGYLQLFVGLPVYFAFGVWYGITRLRGTRPESRRHGMLVLYLCFCIAFVAVIGNTFDMSDTSRYRFATDPFYIALAGLFLQNFVFARLRRMRDGESPAPGQVE